MVNAGAIARSAMAPGASLEERWNRLQDGLSRFAGRRLELEPEIHAAARAQRPQLDFVGGTGEADRPACRRDFAAAYRPGAMLTMQHHSGTEATDRFPTDATGLPEARAPG